MTDWSLVQVRDQDTHLDVHVPVGPAVLVVEPDSVHHLVLEVFCISKWSLIDN